MKKINSYLKSYVKNIDGNLIKITNSEEQAFVNTVVEKIVNAVKER